MSKKRAVRRRLGRTAEGRVQDGRLGLRLMSWGTRLEPKSSSILGDDRCCLRSDLAGVVRKYQTNHPLRRSLAIPGKVSALEYNHIAAPNWLRNCHRRLKNCGKRSLRVLDLAGPSSDYPWHEHTTLASCAKVVGRLLRTASYRCPRIASFALYSSASDASVLRFARPGRA
jgi:hypothetical protein